MDVPEDRILTVREVAAYLQISKSKIYYMLSRDEIPHIRIGRNVRIRRADLHRWMEQQVRRPSRFGD